MDHDFFKMYSTSPDDPDAMLMPCPLIPWRRRDSRHWSGELWACYVGELDNGKHQSFGELEGSLAVTWLWINTYKPISTIFRVMNIHLPAILRFTRGTRFWPIPISTAPKDGLLSRWISAVPLGVHLLFRRADPSGSQKKRRKTRRWVSSNVTILGKPNGVGGKQHGKSHEIKHGSGMWWEIP